MIRKFLCGKSGFKFWFFVLLLRRGKERERKRQKIGEKGEVLKGHEVCERSLGTQPPPNL